jgi:hypothetical protein
MKYYGVTLHLTPNETVLSLKTFIKKCTRHIIGIYENGIELENTKNSVSLAPTTGTSK